MPKIMVVDEEVFCPKCSSGDVIEVEDDIVNAGVNLRRCTDCYVVFMVLDKYRVTAADMMLWRPMLAASMPANKPELWADKNILIEKKYNGDRILGFFGPAGGQFFTRTLSKEDGLPVEKTAHLPHLAKLKLDYLTIVDGEVIIPGKSDHTKMASRIGCLPELAIERQRLYGWVIFVIWDCLMYRGDDIRQLPLIDRIEIRDQVIEDLKNKCPKGIPPSRQYIRKTETGQGKKYFSELIARGEEGCILKNLDAPYYDGDGTDRPAGVWMKKKVERVVELVVMGYKEAKEISTKSSGETSKTKYAGLIGSIKLGAYVDDELVEVCYSSGMDDKLRKQISANRKRFLGKVAAIKCQSVMDTASGISLQNPRLIGWRDDKRPEDCKRDELVRTV